MDKPNYEMSGIKKHIAVLMVWQKLKLDKTAYFFNSKKGKIFIFQITLTKYRINKLKPINWYKNIHWKSLLFY